VLDDLRAVLPDLVTDPGILASLARDSADLLSDEKPVSPLAAVRPTTTAQVAAAVRFAAAHGVPVVPQGARTGLAGGANAVDGALLICLERMDRIIDIDTANRLAVVQPGVVNATLRRAVAEHGLFYPPDPSSYEMSTIGGNVSTNAGGMCCVKYGVTTEYVLGLEVVLADGEVLRCGRRTAKGVAGYDLTRLFVGSEGTLGIITEITLALRPAPPPALTLVAIFGSLRDAGSAVGAITASGSVPSMLELLDKVHLGAIEAYRPIGLPVEAEAMLLVGSDAVGAAEQLATVEALCRTAGATEVYVASDVDEAEALQGARRLSHPAMTELSQRTYGPSGEVIIEDAAVPRSSMAEFCEEIERVAADRGVIIGVVGHAGDGNLHPKILTDRTDPKLMDAARLAFDDIMALTLSLGGTCTGEHGVGLLKRDWLEKEIGPVGMRVHRAVKAALDPANLMNPGKVVGSMHTYDAAAGVA
jgi:glycolate oxidase